MNLYLNINNILRDHAMVEALVFLRLRHPCFCFGTKEDGHFYSVLYINDIFSTEISHTIHIDLKDVKKLAEISFKLEDYAWISLALYAQKILGLEFTKDIQNEINEIIESDHAIKNILRECYEF